MGIVVRYFNNTRRPEGLLGKIMLAGMNVGHGALAEWGFSLLDAAGMRDVLDVGCGGGANLRRWLKRLSEGTVTGADFSALSVEKSRRMNAAEVESGRCRVQQASVRALPFEDGGFDCVSAFETIYFWPEICESFREVWRVLREGGTFLICNESDGENPADERWTRMIEGMTIYRERELRALLEQAGFADICVERRPKRHWIALIAQKPSRASGENSDAGNSDF